MKYIFLIFFLIWGVDVDANHYWLVEFKDKDAYSPAITERYISPKSLQRRKGYTDEYDMPVKKAYIKAITDSGYEVVGVSKWLNAVLIKTDEVEAKKRISKWRMVQYVRDMGTFNSKAAQGFSYYAPDDYANEVRAKEFRPIPESMGYGLAWDQICQLHAQELVLQKPQSIPHIAILDAGFYNAQHHRGFQKVLKNKRVLGCWDYYGKDSMVYEDDDHGMKVWSAMAIQDSPYYIGPATDAFYWLLRTEDAKNEYPAELFFWCLGAEFADSVGADFLVSSLGYSSFDDRSLDMNQAMLDGQTTIVARAASLAAKRKIWVVISNGNEGENQWKTMTTPADALGVISIGAINKDGDLASFSSLGATADARIKPDFVARGEDTWLASSNGWYVTGSGSSYAAPLFAAVLTRLWAPGRELDLVYYALKLTASHPKGDTIRGFGYGIPDFDRANQYIQFKTQGTGKPLLWESWFDAKDTMLKLTLLLPMEIVNKGKLKVKLVQGKKNIYKGDVSILYFNHGFSQVFCPLPKPLNRKKCQIILEDLSGNMLIQQPFRRD